MKRFKLWILIIISALIITLSLNVVKVSADTGPKPDMQITITNLEKSDYIVAYATKYKDYMGPHTAFKLNDEYFNNNYFGNVDDLTLIYNNVKLPEGWYLLDISNYYENTTTLEITSGYYWPKDFILIIYNKANDSYFLTNETKTYAFHSYFEYDMRNFNGEYITLEKNYKYGKEILQFFVRLIVTLVIEMGLALLFKFNKRSFIIILIVNAVTQIGLNLGLNIIGYNSGKSVYIIPLYIFFEILIVGIEAIIYKILCRRGKEETRKWIISYTILANVVSFVLGMILWFIM